MYYLAEDEGLLHKSLDEAAKETGTHLAYAMFAPTSKPAPKDLLERIFGRVDKWVKE